MIDPLYVASGFGVGLLVGMTGVGGGSLMTPLLILLFGIHPSTAVGTDLLYAAATKTGGSVVHGLSRSIHWPAVIRLACGSIPAAVLTLVLMWHFNLDTAAQRSRGQSGAVLCAAAHRHVADLPQVDPGSLSRAHGARRRDARPRCATVLTGAALGVLVSISSVGAGAVGVTALLLLYPRLPMATIVGSDIAHAVPLTLVAGAGHWALGAVDWHLMGVLLLGSLPGIVIGSYCAVRVPQTRAARRARRDFAGGGRQDRLGRAEIVGDAGPGFYPQHRTISPHNRHRPLSRGMHRRSYSAVQPPSIERLAPVIGAASSRHRNSASAATCSEVTNSLVGCAASSTSFMTCSLVRLRAFIVSGICCSTSGVQT